MASCAPGGNGGRGVTPPLTRSAITAAGMVHPNAVDLGARRLRATRPCPPSRDSGPRRVRAGPAPRPCVAAPRPCGPAPVPVRARPACPCGPAPVPSPCGAHACPVRPECPAGTAARPMIMSIPQLISCGISMKSEIVLDHAAPGARAPRPCARGRVPARTRPIQSPLTTQATALGERSARLFPRRREMATPTRHNAPPARAGQRGTSSRTAQDISTVSAGTA